MELREAWDAETENWVAWARDRSDSYWRFHGRRFFELLPPPCATLDIGCGEGRMPRDLKARGYRVVGLDSSAAMIAHAQAADPGGDYRVGDSSALPFEDGAFPLVTSFMALHDTDDVPGAVAEAGRVLAPGGRLCLAIVHPLASAGSFDEPGPDAPLVVRRSYFERRRYADTVEHGDRRMTFHGEHRGIAHYTGAIFGAGLRVEALAEVPDADAAPGSRWARVPLFLHLRAVKP